MLDLTGRRFGLLTVGSTFRRKGKHKVWSCVCDCGNVKEVQWQHLTHGATRSCGCLRKMAMRRVNLKHGRSYSPEYAAWNMMMQRCKNPNNPFFAHYGGRGIKVCERWCTFEEFEKDIGPRPSSRHSLLNRLDNDGDYCPDNCAWSTKIEQARNTSRNVHVNVNGVKMTQAEAAEKAGIRKGTFWARLHSGWTIEDAVTRPLRAHSRG